jgi:preflagellin peptidase FlaK
MNEVLDGLRVLVSLIFLAYASWSDFRKREVSNKVWVIFAPLALALTSLQFLVFSPQSLRTFALSFVITSVLSITLFYAGAFGGADAKALICLSLVLPSYPTDLLQPSFSLISPLFPISVFCNAVLLAALSVFYVLSRNYLWKRRTGKKLFEGFEKESIGRKILTAISGYKIKVVELEKEKFLYPLEDVRVAETGETMSKLIVMPKDEEREEIVERILEASREGRLQSDVWVTPGLPMLVFITAGLILALVLGDIIWIILGLALGFRF